MNETKTQPVMTEQEQLSADVATEIMGWTEIRAGHFGPIGKLPPSYGHTLSTYHVEGYAEDIAAAWNVVERMRADGYCWRVDTELLSSTEGGVTALFWRNGSSGKATADKAPEAISRAALAAKRGESTNRVPNEDHGGTWFDNTPLGEIDITEATSGKPKR